MGKKTFIDGNDFDKDKIKEIEQAFKTLVGIYKNGGECDEMSMVAATIEGNFMITVAELSDEQLEGVADEADAQGVSTFSGLRNIKGPGLAKTLEAIRSGKISSGKELKDFLESNSKSDTDDSIGSKGKIFG